ncbi:MAG: methyl-accepting chemotaxis protein [Marinilabiliaceae bacterium]|nr:methyl-accepting chemotaxis protein [Marinilabiliaceae bacterium]
MKKFSDLRIGLRMIIIISASVVIILSLFGVYMYRTQYNKIINDTNANLNEQVEDLCNIVRLQVKERRMQVDISSRIAQEFFDNAGEVQIDEEQYLDISVVNQESLENKRIRISAMLINGESLYDNNLLVDKITELTGAKATVFQKINDGYLRVSTSVIKSDGNRAVNTYIPNNSPVVKAVESGNDYTGRAVVVDEWYLTTYIPISINGTINGMLFVGIPEKDMANIKQLFAQKNFLKTGYAFIVDKEGTFVVHPKQEGESAKEEVFFKQLVAAGAGAIKVNYLWEGENKILYARYVDEIGSYIAVSIYEKELLSILHNLRNMIGLAVFFSIIIIVLASAYIAKSITSSIQKSVVYANKITNGDLNAQLDVYQKDEVGLLADALRFMVKSFRSGVDMAQKIALGDLRHEVNESNIIKGSLDEALIKMQEQLSNVVQNIRVVAQNVASGSTQISESATDISTGANEQAATAEEVSSAIEQMTAAISQNTENAQDTLQIAKKASIDIDEGRQAFEITFSAMKDIAQKISVIGDIAEKTDLLAINAAIEAARAGDQGKGFAVVAAEVRKLAELSQKAAKEITQLSSSSLSIAEDATKLLLAIVPDVKRTSELIMEISASSNEQKAGAEQINLAMQQFSNVTQSNMANAEEMASSSEELASQAEQLNDVVNYFVIDDEKSMNSFVNNHKKLVKKDKEYFDFSKSSQLSNLEYQNM